MDKILIRTGIKTLKAVANEKEARGQFEGAAIAREAAAEIEKLLNAVSGQN